MNRLTSACKAAFRIGWVKLSPEFRERLLLRVVETLKRPLNRDTSSDACHVLFAEFVRRSQQLNNPRILELGARARSGITRTSLFQNAKYVGFDVVAGVNVDVVGDAHALSSHFRPAEFDAIFSISVFEHLAMPWKVVLECNKVLKVGGLVYVQTHPTWPAHDRPWDFWRFSRHAFDVLFNRVTGFELERCDEGLPCAVVPLGSEPPMLGLWRQPAYLGVSALARKIGEPDERLRWDVATSDVIGTSYPRSSG